MSPQPELVRHDRHAPHDELDHLFRRGAIIRAEAQRVRSMSQETREMCWRRVEAGPPLRVLGLGLGRKSLSLSAAAG